MNILCFNMGGWQLIVVVLLILLLFGGKKIPELMRGLGRGVHEFKQGMEDAKREMNRPLDSESKNDDKPKAKDVD